MRGNPSVPISLAHVSLVVSWIEVLQSHWYICAVLLIRYKVQIGFIYKNYRDSVPTLRRLMLDISILSPDIQYTTFDQQTQ